MSDNEQYLTQKKSYMPIIYLLYLNFDTSHETNNEIKKVNNAQIIICVIPERDCIKENFHKKFRITIT